MQIDTSFLFLFQKMEIEKSEPFNKLSILYKVASCFEERDKTVVCGILTGTNQTLYTLYIPWLSRSPLEIFSTLSRPHIPLLKSSDVASCLGITLNCLSMYLSRHKEEKESGIIQAYSVIKYEARKDLKTHGYFMSIRAVKDYVYIQRKLAKN